MSTEDDKNDRAHLLRSLALLSAVLVDTVGFTLAGLGLGYLAWRYWDWPWWFMVLSGILAFVMGIYRLYQFSESLERTRVRSSNESKEIEEKKEP
jgi:F0F1-type ATP synthase assembly protein I